MIIECYHEFNRGAHDHRSPRRPTAPQHPGSAGARPRCGRGRCRRTTGRQGREHPPGLNFRLAAVPDVGRGRWPPRTARCPAGRGPLPGPLGLNRPVHRHRPAGPLGHLPLSRRRQLTTIPKSYLSRIINLLGIRPQRQQWGQPSTNLRLTAVRLPDGGRQRHAPGEATPNRQPDASGQAPRSRHERHRPLPGPRRRGPSGLRHPIRITGPGWLGRAVRSRHHRHPPGSR